MQALEGTRQNSCGSAVVAFASFPEEIAICEFTTEIQSIP